VRGIPRFVPAANYAGSFGMQWNRFRDVQLDYPKEHPRHFGPPMNISHLREWSFAEFAAYIGLKFEIAEHRVTNTAQATQMVICTRRAVKGGGRVF